MAARKSVPLMVAGRPAPRRTRGGQTQTRRHRPGQARATRGTRARHAVAPTNSRRCRGGPVGCQARRSSGAIWERGASPARALGIGMLLGLALPRPSPAGEREFTALVSAAGDAPGAGRGMPSPYEFATVPSRAGGMPGTAIEQRDVERGRGARPGAGHAGDCAGHWNAARARPHPVMPQTAHRAMEKSLCSKDPGPLPPGRGSSRRSFLRRVMRRDRGPACRHPYGARTIAASKPCPRFTAACLSHYVPARAAGGGG